MCTLLVREQLQNILLLHKLQCLTYQQQSINVASDETISSENIKPCRHGSNTQQPANLLKMLIKGWGAK